MKGQGLYDKELQMFCETAGEPNLAKLGFLRWLVERGKLEHEAAGQPAGEFARLDLIDSRAA
jgi:hypothetical protein